MFKIIKFWVFPVVWMGFIYFLSSFHKLQVSQVGWEDFVTRKIAHMTEYCVLYVLLFRAFKNYYNFSFRKLIFYSLLITFLYAISDEYHQTFVTGRTGKFTDIFIDLLGGTLGFFVLKLVPPNLKNKFSL
jgi:VanZ family protein